MRSFALVLLLCACGSAPASVLVGSDAPIVIGAPAMWKFEPASSGAGIALEPVTLEQTRAVFALRGKQLGPLHGVAFRVVFDPSVAEFVRYTPSGDWAIAPLIKVAEVRPGIVVVVVSQHGPTGALAADELGRIELTLKDSTTASFALERTIAMGNNGARIDFAWRGGSLRR